MVCFGFFRRGGIVFDEPDEELCIIDLLAEHLFAAGGVTYQLVSFLCVILKLLSKKRYKLEVDSVEENNKGKGEKGKGKGEKDKGENKGKQEKK